MQMIDVRLSPCLDPTTVNNINSTVCASLEDQAKWFNGVNMVVYPINHYFDFNDFNEPVKGFIDDTFFYPIQPFFCKQSLIYIRQSFTDLKDQFFSFANGVNKTLYSIQREKNVVGNNDSYIGFTYVSVQFRLDFYQDTYSRQVYGIMDLVGDVGGVQTILVVFGGYLTSIIAERLMNAEMMRQIYHTEYKGKESKKRKRPVGKKLKKGAQSRYNIVDEKSHGSSTLQGGATHHPTAESSPHHNSHRYPSSSNFDEEKGSTP